MDKEAKQYYKNGGPNPPRTGQTHFQDKKQAQKRRKQNSHNRTQRARRLKRGY